MDLNSGMKRTRKPVFNISLSTLKIDAWVTRIFSKDLTTAARLRKSASTKSRKSVTSRLASALSGILRRALSSKMFINRSGFRNTSWGGDEAQHTVVDVQALETGLPGGFLFARQPDPGLEHRLVAMFVEKHAVLLLEKFHPSVQIAHEKLHGLLSVAPGVAHGLGQPDLVIERTAGRTFCRPDGADGCERPR